MDYTKELKETKHKFDTFKRDHDADVMYFKQKIKDLVGVCSLSVWDDLNSIIVSLCCILIHLVLSHMLIVFITR